ncbi:MAG: Sec-independent protein translocase subunit TatA/TatB [Luteibaculaceae bacterium]
MAVLLFFSIGGGELIFIFIFVLMFFGAKSIPSVARNLGRGMRQMKDAMSDIQSEISNSAKEIKSTLDQPSSSTNSTPSPSKSSTDGTESSDKKDD